ncbi:MAG: hypothetical protein ABEK01_03335 [Candidatus Nanohaloarchaea archaeon]
MRKRDFIYLVLGLGLFGLAATTVLAPGAVLRKLPLMEALSSASGPLSLGVLAASSLVVLMYALWSARPSETDLKNLDPGIPPETPEDAGGEFVGEKIDEMIEAGDEEHLRERFRATAKQLAGEESLRDGSWTGSRIAACFVNADLKYPLLERLREWLESEDQTLERRTRKTVEALEEVYRDE